MTRAEQIMVELKKETDVASSDYEVWIIIAQKLFERLDELETEIAKVREEIS